MFRIIDNQKVNMTDEEYAEYIKICRAYDRSFFHGEELFKDFFVTNEEGVIIYIKALGNKQFSFEIMMFVMNLMQNQWLRRMTTEVNNFITASDQKLKTRLTDLDNLILKLNNKQ